MVFSSIPFLFFFLPVFMAAYFAAPGIKAKNLSALAFSLAFYAWGEPKLVLVLLFSILFNWSAALWVDRLQGRARCGALGGIVAANLLLLGAFKYAAFAAGILNDALAPLGWRIAAPQNRLPLGISFFTFHCLSYVIDVYRRRFVANRNLPQIALYITLFPQLIAGPIVRYGTVAGQLRERHHTLGRASAGMRTFIIGLAQKVLIADQIAPIAEAVFDRIPHPSLIEAWLGLFAYTLQIYFDFGGYSNMAIGLGLALGFTLPRNFLRPYTCLSVSEFWRHWHMSLSSWLRDYLYFPLGGSHAAPWQTWRNLITVFLLCGLWHGANWTFVFWGAWHGGFLVVERAGFSRLLARLPTALRWAYTILAVMGGWVLFRAADLGSAGRFYGALLGRHGVGRLGFTVHMALTPLAGLMLVVGCTLALAPRSLPGPRPPQSVLAVADTASTFAMLLLTALFVAAGSYSPFLYFRF